MHLSALLTDRGVSPDRAAIALSAMAAAAVVGRLAELGWDRNVFGSIGAMLIGSLAIYLLDVAGHGEHLPIGRIGRDVPVDPLRVAVLALAPRLEADRTDTAQQPLQRGLRLAGQGATALWLPSPRLLQGITAYADSDIVYSFDGDWGNEPYWEPYVPYQYFSHYDRQRATLAQDLRLTSHGTARGEGFGWLAGAYALRFDEDTLQRDYFTDELLRPPLDAVLPLLLHGIPLILSGASAVELRTKAVENGMITLRGSGLQKIRDGMTTIDEVVRETVS